MFLHEHVGFEHNPHDWWIYDSRETSPKTCPLCLSLHTSHYRGDAIDFAFPYHVHRRVNNIRVKVHPHCRCVLHWAGRTKDVLANPYGVRRPPKVPVIPKTVAGKPVEDALVFSQRKLRRQIVKHARETWRSKS